MKADNAQNTSGWTLETLRAYLEQRFDSMDKALDLQTTELSRRLQLLNHAHERAVEVQSTYVPREVFEEVRGAVVAALPREVYDRRHQELERDVEALKRLMLPRESFDKTVADWTIWRSAVDKVLAGAAERKAVLAALLMGGISLLGVAINMVRFAH